MRPLQWNAKSYCGLTWFDRARHCCSISWVQTPYCSAHNSLLVRMAYATPGIYLDYAATTPVAPEVANEIAKFLTIDGKFGNPHSSNHHFGHAANQAVESARVTVARLIGAQADEIVFTSGATEAINIAIKGVLQSSDVRGRHLVVSSLEHKAVLDTADWLAQHDFEVDRVPPNLDGQITPSIVGKCLRPDTALVSIMHVNNEVGTITDIASIAPVVHEVGALLHVDAAQSLARLPIDVHQMDVDLLSISGHKIYGPKGIGALYVKRSIRPMLEAQTHGGGQESGLRSGTLPTHQIVGLSVASQVVRARLQSDLEHVAVLDDCLVQWISRIEGTRLNGNQSVRVPGILNVAFRGVEAESLMLALGDIAVSSGSACTTTQIEPSHVLLELGVPETTAMSSIRFSSGRYTTVSEIETVGQRLQTAVDTLRSIVA